MFPPVTINYIYLGVINIIDIVVGVNIVILNNTSPTEYELWALDINNDNDIYHIKYENEKIFIDDCCHLSKNGALKISEHFESEGFPGFSPQT